MGNWLKRNAWWIFFVSYMAMIWATDGPGAPYFWGMMKWAGICARIGSGLYLAWRAWRSRPADD